MTNDDDKKWLYNKLKNQGYNIGTYDEFSSSLNNEEDRKWYYDKASSMKLNVGTYDDFNKMFGTTTTEEAPAAPADTVAATMPKDTVPTNPTAQPAEQNIFNQPQIPIKTTYTQQEWEKMDANQRLQNAGNVVISPEKPWTMEQEAAWSGLTPEARKVIIGDDKVYNMFESHLQHQQAGKLQTANRQQVADLTTDIDSELTRRGAELDRKASEQRSWWQDLPRGGGGAITTFNFSTNNGRMADQEYKDLSAARNQLTEAQRIINEADINAKNGTMSDWLKSSFAGGASRGFGQKLFDVSTWDAGMTDLNNNVSALMALKAFDEGKPLTRSQEMLLDAMSVKLATDAYFGSYVGRGYKAGQVTAESIPFMIEMCINPASTAGKSATSQLSRYAIQRFGKQALKKNAKKYAATKAATRVLGDVAGSALMSASTGTGRMTADAVDRMTGQVTYDTDLEDGTSYFTGHTEGDDALTAFGKAFASTTIENYSEMVGNYFAPALGMVGRGVRKGMEKIGLGSVGRFIDNVAASDVAKLVTDFEKSSQWNGLIGEYAEEVAGNIMNALVVGDMTLDTAEGTGVFNLDQNIDTFLGVSLMGGFLSSVKTLGYRTPKYRAKKDMQSKDNAASLAFGDQEAWGGIRNTLAFGNEEEVKSALNDVLANDSYTEQQKAAALDYAKAVETYRGMIQGESKRREEEDPTQVDTETSFDNGYSLEAPQEQNDAKNMLDYQRENMKKLFGMDDVDESIGDPLRYIAEMRELGRPQEEIQAVIDYANAKATYDGMIQHVRDDIDGKIEQSNARIDSYSNETGMIQPATMKVDDRQVYVVNGKIVMNEDGTGIDTGKSDEFIVIRDAQTGNLETTNPHNVLSVDEPIDAASQKSMLADQIMQEEAQKAARQIDGTLSFNPGDTYTLTDEEGKQMDMQVVPNEQGIVDNGDGTVNVTYDGGTTVIPMQKEQIQQMNDATNLARLAQFEQEKAGKRAMEAADEQAASRPSYAYQDELTLKGPDGTGVRGSIVSEMNDDGQFEVYTETPINGKKVNLFTPEELDGMVIEHNGAPVTNEAAQETEGVSVNDEAIRNATVEDYKKADPNINESYFNKSPELVQQYLQQEVPPTVDYLNGKLSDRDYLAAVGYATGENSWLDSKDTTAEDIAKAAREKAQSYLPFINTNADAGTQQQEAQQQEAPTVEPMPMIGEGENAEPDFASVTPQRSHDFLYNEAGLSNDEANAFVQANIDATKKQLEKVKKSAPKMGTSLSAYKKQQQEYQTKVNEAQQKADYWAQVKAEHDKVKSEEMERRRKEQEAATSQAILEEQQRIEEEKRKAEEQQRIGTNNVAPAIRERWNQAPKVEGSPNEIVLANGEKVPGRYVLVESGAATPSHNVANGFAKTEGFPIDENEQSVNDRDYERDKQAQDITRQIAGNYDSRALQTPVVVSNDGIVLSGNGRTMAGEMAAAGNTDAAYIEYLQKYPEQFGFTKEQIAGMKHPRVVFVPNDAMPYTAETFAKFNQQDMKGQSKTEQAVKLGKVVDDNTFNQIVRRINSYDSLGDFYADSAAANEAIKALHGAGVINSNQLAEMFDGETLSASGKELLENLLIGKAFESNPDAVRQITAFKSVRQAVISALSEISNNVMLGKEYSLENELSQAIALVYAARKNGVKAGESASAYARQGNLFQIDEGATVADYNNATVMMLADILNDGRVTRLKRALSVYNAQANDSAQGQMDLFTGSVVPKDEILKFVNQLFSNGTEEQQAAAVRQADERRKENSVQQDVDSGTGNDGNGTGQQAAAEEAEISAEEALAKRTEVTDNEWEEQDPNGPVYYRSIIIDGSHEVTQVDEPDKKGEYTGSYFIFNNERFAGIPEVISYIDSLNIDVQIEQARQEVNTSPTEAQIKAGNYRKGHVKIDGFDITIENPKGSVRSGVDEHGNKWSTEMQNDYGYIKGTESVDGDHIDIFLSDHLNDWNGTVYVVDQMTDGGGFDEHKVMYGFNSLEEAREAYLSNYRKGWKGLGSITGVSKDDFRKWVDSSHRKTKPFSEYKSVQATFEKKEKSASGGSMDIVPKPNGKQNGTAPLQDTLPPSKDSEKEEGTKENSVKKEEGFTVERRFHKKNGTYIYAVKFTELMDKDAFKALKTKVKNFGGYYSSFGKGGFIFDNEEDARKFASAVLDKSGEQLDDAEPLSLHDVQSANGDLAEDNSSLIERIMKGSVIKWAELYLKAKSQGDEKNATKWKNNIREVIRKTYKGEAEEANKWAEQVFFPYIEKNSQEPSKGTQPEKQGPGMKEIDVISLMQELKEKGEAKLSDHVKDNSEEQPSAQPETKNPSGNRLVTDERYAELRERMRKKLGGQMNMGIDPEILAIGTEMAVYHIEKGARKFAEYAKAMIEDMGDAIRPYLKAFYNGARDLPEMEDAGYTSEMTSYDEVRKFDIANFDKEQGSIMATAEMVVKENQVAAQAEEAKNTLTNQRNEQRRKDNEQTSANTETVASQAETVASKAESDIEAATDEKQVNGTVEEIDRQLDKVNEQLALLGYYEADQVEGDFNEAYGYMRNAEKKAVKDANNLANRLVKDIGIDPKTIVDKKGKRRRSIATANIAPIGGDISIHLPLGEKRELYISIQLDNQDGDNLKVTGGMLRIENPNPERGEERYLSFNNFFAEDETYPSLLRMAQQLVKRYAPDFVPVSNEQQEASTKSEKKPAKRQKKQQEPKIADLFSGQEETIPESQEDKNVNAASLDDENTEINRKFANAVKTDMLSALDSGTKPYRSILDLRKRAAGLGMEVDNDGRTDILLQELVEDGLVRAAREVVNKHGRDSRESYDLICKLYDMQPTIAARSSNRIKMQQYSTPLPMAWNATRFAMIGKKDGKVLEPTAGNGMLVFAVPANQVYVNELDETRLDNLREQGFAQVTQQDATEPFEGGQQYDVIIANPPFGKRDEVEYDGKMIPGLDPQITLNALASMKDNGKAAIIIGGNMEYGNNGGLKSMKPFFTYLYDHYNVKGVVDMDGKLYSKQGTTFPTRMILIAGRRSNEERAQTAVYPPIESKAIRKADSFDDLYDIIDEVINSKEKTNGTEILRSQQGQLVSVADQPSRNTDGTGHSGQSRKNDDTGHGQRGTAHSTESNSGRSQQVLSREHRTDTGNGETRRGAGGNTEGGSRGVSEPDVQRVGTVGVSTERVGLGETRTEQPKKRTLTEEKSAYRPHNSAFSLQSVAPAAMVEAMDNVLSQIEAENGNIDEFVRKELGYDTIEETHQALAAEQVDSVAMAIYQMKKGQALIIGDQTGVGKGRQMAALIRWAVKRGEKPIFITQKADLFSDIYRDLVDIGSGDLVPFIFNSDGAMVDSNGNTVHKPLSSKEMAKVFAAGQLPDEYDFAVLTYSQVNTGDEVSQKEAEEAAKKRGGRTKKSKASKDGKATPKATFLRAIAEDNYLFLDESHTAAGTSNTGAYLQSILRSAKAATFASATFAKRPDTMPLYAIRTAMSQAKVEPDKLIGIIEKGGVTLQEIMSRELTNAGQMVRRERDMSDVVTDWKTINDPATVKRARENYDRTIAAFNAIIKFQEDYVKPMVDAMDKELAIMAESAGIKRGTDKMGVENVPFASKTYNYTKQLMLALKVDAIANEVDAEIKAGRHPVIALESTMESSIKDYSAGEVISEPTFSASLLRGLDTVMQYTIKDENGKEQHARYTPKQLGEAGEKAYYELQDFIRKSTSDIFISPLDAIIERLHEMGYKVGELTGRNMYVERDDDGRVVVRRRTDKDKKRMQREFNSGELDVLILNKSASTGISLHASEKFSDQRQRTMIIAQPLSDINDYMQMIGRIDRTGQVHRGYYINLGLPVPAENRFLMMLSTKLKSLNANTTTSQDSESNDVEAPDLLNKYGSQVVVEYLRDNPEIYEKMGGPLKKAGQGGGRVQTNELDEYKPQEDDARKITGYVALLTTKEQEEFYDDVVRRYNELIKYLNDTGNNDLKITVMPLRAKTLNKRVSSEGIDPTGTNPFARNSYVEQVEMDVLRKPMKAAEIRKTIEQVNKGKRPEDYIRQVIATIEKEDEVRIAAEEARYERSKAKAQEDIAKQTEKINRQQKRTAEEKQAAIADYVRETNENVETKHNDNIVRLNTNSDMLKQRLHMFEVGKSYLMPDNLESMVFDFSTPAIFCGYKAKDSKITASTTLAVFATLDGRRRMEIKLSQPEALRSIYKTTNDNWDAARSTTLENWDSQIPTGTRKTGFIMTGNILQAIADTQDEHGGYPGQLISYTDIDGNVHDGILMPDKWNTSMLKTSGAPIISRLKQIKDYMPVTSHDGKVDITGSSWAKVYYLTVPKTKKDGAIYYENKALLRAVNGSNFYPYRGKLRADIPEGNIEKVVMELSKLGVKVKEETNEDDALYRLDDYTTNEEEANDLFRVVDDASEITRLNSEPTVKVYRAMSLVDGKLYPPMSKKIGTGSNRISQAPSEFGQWEVSDERPELVEKEGTHKNHIYIVKDNGKGLWVAYNPYFHTSRNPLNDQFAEAYQRPNLVTVEVEVPESELTSGYQAEGAKDPVGETKWNAGPVNRQLSGDKKRKVILSRWMRPVRIVPDSEVAQRIAELIEGENVAIPDNTVTPSLLEELKKLGVKIVDGISKGRKKATAMMRGGNGALTDNELSYENDPVAKMTGRSTRTAAQRRAFAERERQRMVNAVQKLAETLHLDNVDIVTDASTLQGKRAKAKGFYSRGIGRITIVIPNHTSVYDVEQTLLHEAVAHYGLRQLFGEHFDTFLDNVFNNVSSDIRRRIVDLAKKNGWNFRVATEEYLAALAEDTNFENAKAEGWWNKVKQFFLRMLTEVGITLPTLTDNELRYILWRSYMNLKEPGTRSIFGQAEDVSMQSRLKVGNYSSTPENGPLRFRDQSIDGIARRMYEDATRRKSYRWQEAYQDSMLGLLRMQQAIAEESGEDITDNENAYVAENQMSSRSTYETEFYKDNYFKPMMKAVTDLMKKGRHSYNDVVNYLIAKSGLERNVELAFRDALQANSEDDMSAIKSLRDAYLNDPERSRLIKDLNDGKISWSDYRVQDDMLREQYAPGYLEFREKDYSGLTALTGEETDYETVARQMVNEMEQDDSDLTDNVWKAVNAATKETLRKAYESGLMSKSQYEYVKGMFEYYIPLRGWAEDTAADVYDYLTSERSSFNPPVKNAKRRLSLADDPLATIGNMAESAIFQGNRNLMKQKFLNMVMNHPTSLATVSEMWYENKGTEENPIWVESVPEIPDDATADEVAAIVDKHEADMNDLRNKGMATKKRGHLTIDYRASKREKQEHSVKIKRNGKDYVVYVNGNPRAAQALNGLTTDSMQHKFMKLLGRVKRQMTANFTTRNPAFVVSNLSRDLIFSGSAVAMKENRRYVGNYTKNILSLLGNASIPRLMWKRHNGTLDMNNPIERYFSEFLRNGGETGYTNLHSVDEYKKLIAREIVEAQGRIDVGSIIGMKPGRLTTPTTLGIVPAFRFVAKWTEFFNRCAEDTCRFAVYMTSRQQGRSVVRSINDAKEITVNFNKKGAGGLGATTFNTLYFFFNAAVQSLANAVRLAKSNPVKFAAWTAGFTAAGILVPMMNQILINALGGDDDKDAYNNLPDWIRRNNLVFWLGGERFLTIPLPIELRAFYGSGELFHSITSGIENKNVGYKILAQFSDLLPLNLTGGGGDALSNVIPGVGEPFYQVMTNTDYFGKPIYKDNDYNKLMPEWTKAYSGTSKQLIRCAELLNELTGGDKYMKGALDINPAVVEHFFESYFGGMGKTVNQLGKGISAIWDEDQRNSHNIPVVNRFYSSSDERNAFSRVNEEYYHYLEEYEQTQQRIRGYENEDDASIMGYAEKIDFLENSKEYERYEIMSNYMPDIKDLQDEIKETEDRDERKDLEMMLNTLKSELVDELKETEK